IAHLPAANTGLRLKTGDTVRAAVDWDLRYARMRMHTALHLLSAVLPYPVTGGAGGDPGGPARLHFSRFGTAAGWDYPKACRDDRGRGRSALALDNRCGTGSRA